MRGVPLRVSYGELTGYLLNMSSLLAMMSSNRAKRGGNDSMTALRARYHWKAFPRIFFQDRINNSRHTSFISKIVSCTFMMEMSFFDKLNR